MSERQSESIEHKQPSIERAAGERLNELERKQEHGEQSKENAESRLERARTEAQQEALFTKEYSSEQKQTPQETSQVGIATRGDRERGFKTTMKHVQSRMNAPERAFSKVIHNKVVERVSDVTGSTVARPNSILFGSIFAFLGVAGVYLYARHIGFALSGFETIAAFIVGWLVGMFVDLIRVIFSNKR